MAVALVVGTACKGPDGLDVNLNSFEVVLRGANVVPAAADTTTAGYLTITGGATITWAGKVISKGPATGTIDSIGIYQQAAGTALAATANATALLCATAAACAAASGTATLVGTATAATVTTSMRGYGSQLVVFTTVSGATAALRMASGGVMRGTIYNLGS
jgi:hypothetical protein